MKCKNKIVRVTGIRYDGNVQFTIPFAPLQKYLK